MTNSNEQFPPDGHELSCAGRSDLADDGANRADILVAGIDVGARTTKAVILDGREIVSSAVLYTAIDPKNSARKALGAARDQRGIKKGRFRKIMGTGYGRAAPSFVDATATEISCQAKGVHFLNPEVRTVIDIGGRDSRVIHLDEKGNMVDFEMNNTCAAGSGKIFEMLARVLEIDLTSLAGMRPTAHRVTVNSMCMVNAETEILSMLARDIAPAHIVNAINRAFAMRVVSMAQRLGIKPRVAFTGGVAKNRGLVHTLSEVLAQSFEPLPIDCQLTGALGAALLAQESIA